MRPAQYVERAYDSKILTVRQIMESSVGDGIRVAYV